MGALLSALTADSRALAVHLVTVAEYRRFIESGGYLVAELWDDAGWHWRNAAHDDGPVVGPRFWGDPQWAAFFEAERPIVFVSWFEARAYCRWADRRLPREQEWEAAVRGRDGRLFPWGDAWAPGRVGNRGVGDRITWPIGSWPQSVGPFGHHDLVGNVWQLCLDPYADGSTSKAARGGAWSAPNHQCRADARNGFKPDGRHSHVGFRTAALP